MRRLVNDDTKLAARALYICTLSSRALLQLALQALDRRLGWLLPLDRADEFFCRLRLRRLRLCFRRDLLGATATSAAASRLPAPPALRRVTLAA